MTQRKFKRYRPASWQTERIPEDCIEREYTKEFPGEIIVFVFGKSDKYQGGYAYWLACIDGVALDGVGVVGKEENYGKGADARSTLDGIANLLPFIDRWLDKGWPAPYLVIINRPIYEYLTNEDKQVFYKKWWQQDWDRINTLKDVISYYHQGKIKGLIYKKHRNRNFYVVEVAIAYIKTVGRNYIYFKQEHKGSWYPRKLTASEYIQFHRSSQRELTKRGIYGGKLKPLTSMPFVMWVLDNYGEAKDPRDILAGRPSEEEE